MITYPSFKSTIPYMFNAEELLKILVSMMKAQILPCTWQFEDCNNDKHLATIHCALEPFHQALQIFGGNLPAGATYSHRILPITSCAQWVAADQPT